MTAVLWIMGGVVSMAAVGFLVVLVAGAMGQSHIDDGGDGEDGG